VQGEGGFYVAPPEFVKAVRELCDKHSIVMIADEVQAGAGRTGTWLACEQWPVAPDLITMAKSIGGGFPISAVIGKAEIMDKPQPGGLGGTYAGSPIACAAALAVLDVFEEEKLLDRSKAIGELLTTGFKAMAQRHKSIADVRGMGSMVAIELCKNGDPHQPDAELTKRVCTEAIERGLVLLSCGVYANVIRVLVPLTASDALLQEGMKLLEESLVAASQA
jgi:4-aminobutyrate aminotransferase/(S)-3-amino-2-methylpropionate transaminase